MPAPLYMLDDFWPAPKEHPFLIPKWHEVAGAIDDTRDEPDRPAAWADVRDRFLTALVEKLNQQAPALHFDPTDANHPPRFAYCTARSEHFVIVAPYQQDVTSDLTTLGE